MPRNRQMTWAELGYRNAGFRAASRALKFALAWGLATAELGREPTSIEEYAQVTEESRATAFRDQQAFRKAFPSETTPLRMNMMTGAQERYDELWRQLTDRSRVASEAQPLVFMLGGSPAT